MVTLGAELAAARAAAGMSIEDLAAVTRMRASVLAAVEGDDFEVLGPMVYARGHLRTIATVINLDPDYVIERFVSGAETTSQEHSP
jgi:cytoskeleton protein RodZ